MLHAELEAIVVVKITHVIVKITEIELVNAMKLRRIFVTHIIVCAIFVEVEILSFVVLPDFRNSVKCKLYSSPMKMFPNVWEKYHK